MSHFHSLCPGLVSSGFCLFLVLCFFALFFNTSPSLHQRSPPMGSHISSLSTSISLIEFLMASESYASPRLCLNFILARCSMITQPKQILAHKKVCNESEQLMMRNTRSGRRKKNNKSAGRWFMTLKFVYKCTAVNIRKMWVVTESCKNLLQSLRRAHTVLRQTGDNAWETVWHLKILAYDIDLRQHVDEQDEYAKFECAMCPELKSKNLTKIKRKGKGIWILLLLEFFVLPCLGRVRYGAWSRFMLVPPPSNRRCQHILESVVQHLYIVGWLVDWQET